MLTDEQIEYIKKDIKSRGVSSEDLINELTDHICCIIEQKGYERSNFFEIHRSVINEFVPANFLFIQNLTNKLLSSKKNKEMKTTKIIIGSLVAYATFVMILSLFFEMANLELADPLRMTGFVVYATAFLIATYYFIRFKIKNVNLRIIAGLSGYLFFLFLLALGLRETDAESGNSLLQVIPFVSIGTAGLVILFLLRYRKQMMKATINPG